MSPVRPSGGESLQEMIDRYNRELMRMEKMSRPPETPMSPHAPENQRPPMGQWPAAQMPRPEPDEPLYRPGSGMPRPEPYEPLDGSTPQFMPSMGAREQGLRDMEQAKLDREQGLRDIGQGQRDYEQGLRDIEQANRDREQGMKDISQGWRDREQGLRDMEQGRLDREQGMRDIVQGHRDRENGQVEQWQNTATDRPAEWAQLLQEIYRRLQMLEQRQCSNKDRFNGAVMASSQLNSTQRGMPTQPIAQTSSQTTSQTPEEGFGTLIVQVFTARRAQPVRGAQVAVTLPSEGGELLYGLLSTDEDGRTQPIRLPVAGTAVGAPSFASPYANYRVYAGADRFRPSGALTAQMFPGVTSILPVELIPGEGEGR